MGVFHPEDRVAVLSTSTGTGTMVFATTTAPKGYVMPTIAGYAVGDTWDGRIVAPDGSAWEAGKHMFTGATSITRLQVYSNSLGTTGFINFNNSKKTIFVDEPAFKIKVLYAGTFTDGSYS